MLLVWGLLGMSAGDGKLAGDMKYGFLSGKIMLVSQFPLVPLMPW